LERLLAKSPDAGLDQGKAGDLGCTLWLATCDPDDPGGRDLAALHGPLPAERAGSGAEGPPAVDGEPVPDGVRPDESEGCTGILWACAGDVTEQVPESSTVCGRCGRRCDGVPVVPADALEAGAFDEPAGALEQGDTEEDGRSGDLPQRRVTAASGGDATGRAAGRMERRTEVLQPGVDAGAEGERRRARVAIGGLTKESHRRRRSNVNLTP